MLIFGHPIIFIIIVSLNEILSIHPLYSYSQQFIIDYWEKLLNKKAPDSSGAFSPFILFHSVGAFFCWVLLTQITF